MSTTLIILVVSLMVALSAGGIGYAIAAPGMASRKRQMQRIQSVSKAPAAAKVKKGSVVSEADASQARRKQVQQTLKELEERQKAHKQKLTLKLRMRQAGIEAEPRAYYIWSAVVGIVLALICLIAGYPPAVMLLAAFAGGFGAPRWFLGYLTKRRQNAFLEEFPNAVDVIVRGVKAGLPLNDCLKIIGDESPDPVGAAFRELVESQRIGRTLEEGLQRMLQRMPLPEVNFFLIVLTIQQKTGGNLSEALGNLSRVLRGRKNMRAKIQAVSMEAKSSAAIIGSLPPAVMALVYLTTPDYISLLFTDKLGQVMVTGCLIWMGMGILIMRKMINFDF